MGKTYFKRVIDSHIKKLLRSSGAVLIEGPKWCGKTRTAREIAASAVFMQDPQKGPAYRKSAEVMPSSLLEGPTPRLIDEWQIAPVLWDAVRFEVDERGEMGQFILTGSAVPGDDKARHSGTGRISRALMRPMSLFESMESNGCVSLRSLFDGAADVRGESSLSIRDLAFALVRGGWPGAVGMSGDDALGQIRNYVEATVNADVSEVDGVRRNPAAVRELMRSISRNVSSPANMSTIRGDMSGDGGAVSDKTVSAYMNALRRIYVVEDLPAWNPSLRSKTAVRSSPKRHFVDPSIAAASLRISDKGLMQDFDTFGLMFESLCVRDLRVYAQALDGDVYHYRDRNGLEADAVVHLRDGRWGAIEVKMGSREIEEAAANLIKLRDMVDAERSGAPSFLMVLTAEDRAYRRADGVLSVPIGCLRD
ncbi:MAG: ATP-binding protein [Candidatus Methanoplasma sp.]|jgi:predicted AAA+ superfamily ATPase|nr:ATP-binding protein [Candidatus Methanoplasma sp.]